MSKPEEMLPPQNEPESAQLDYVEELPDLATIQERHPDWPKLELSFYFAPHGNNKDMEGIAPQLAKADILLYEEVVAHEDDVAIRYENLDDFNKLSVNPAVSLRRAMRDGEVSGSSYEPLLKGIYKSKKAIGLIDIGDTNYERELVQEMQTLFDQSWIRGMEYSEALSAYNETWARMGELMHQREVLMVEKFEKEIDRILYARPDLLKQDSAKILISMGAGHTTLRHLFRQAGMQSERNFSTESPYTFSYFNELIRTHMFNREPSERLVKQALTESILSRSLDKMRENFSIRTDDDDTYKRRIVSLLTDDELEGAYEAWSEHANLRAYFDNALQRHGVDHLARSDKEIREFIKRPKKTARNLAKIALRDLFRKGK